MAKASKTREVRGESGTKARGAQPGDRAFVLGVALLLVVAAVLTNLPVAEQAGWPGYLFCALIWLLTVGILLNDARARRSDERRAAAPPPSVSGWTVAFRFVRARGEKAILLSLAIVALFSVASHYNFGRFHRDGNFLHYHEFFHYYMGSKYSRELGYDGLYAATHRALLENDRSLSDAISLVRNLRTYQREGSAVARARADTVARLFSEQRWQEFKQDVLFFQSKLSRDGWQFLLVDHGFNATPFWTLLGSACSSHLPLNDRTLLLLAALDLLLIAMMLALVWHAFGVKTSLLFAIFFFANFFAVFDITGGGFLRQLWFAALVAFVCFLGKGRPAAAGVALAIAALDRVFPLLFLLLPVVLFVRDAVRGRSSRQQHARLLAAFAACCVLLGGLSAATSSDGATWRDWYRKVRTHNRGFFINQIAMRNLFVINPATTRDITAEGWDEALWLREREAHDAQSRNSLQAVRAILLALLLVLMAGSKPPERSLGLLSFAPFILLYPANYYCGVLAVAVLCWRRSFGLALTVQALQGVFWLLRIGLAAAVYWELLHWIVSLCLVLTFAIFLAVALLRNAREQPGLKKACLAVGVCGILGLAGAVAADVRSSRTDADRIVLDVAASDVRDLRGVTVHSEQMAKWGNGWSRGDHLAFVAQGPGAQGSVNLPARAAGSFRVKVDYSTAPPFGVVRLAVNGQPAGKPANLFSPRVGMLSVIYEGIELRAGDNELTFTVEGKDPASSDYHFAIDRLVAEREAAGGAATGTTPHGASRREALDKAVSWVVAHPADCFDGGRNDICAEIVTLYGLASNPRLAGSRSRYLDAIQKRFDRLNARSAYRARPDEYEWLAAAAYVGRQLGIACKVFDPASDAVRRWAESYYGEGAGLRSLLLSEYLRRITPGAESRGKIDRSVLHREHTQRVLSEMLAGDVDRRKVGAVSAAFFSIAQDVCALTDFGREPPPQSDVLADREYWAGLCEAGLRWGRETGDVVTVARLVLVARCLGIEPLVPALEPALDFLVRRQEPDGCFGVSDPRSPNAFRPGVLAAIMAIASSL